MSLSSEQSLQEQEYEIPYHYLIRWNSLLSFPDKLHSAPIYLFYLEDIIDKLGPLNREMRVLDAGCGDGRLIYELRTSGCEATLVGIDYSERAVQFARVFNPDVDFSVDDLTKPKDMHVEPFDVVVSVETLEHIEPAQLQSVVDYLAGCVKPGGRLVVTVPHKNRPMDPKHYQHFSADSLKHALLKSFESIEIYGFYRRTHKEIILKMVTVLYYFVYPLKKVGMEKIVDAVSRAGFSYFKKNLGHCGPDEGQSLIAVCRKNP